MTEADVAALESAMRDEFPALRFVAKRDSAVQRALGVLLRVATLGGQRSYATRYVTTMGRTIYLPDGWSGRTPLDRAVTLRHERVHLRQFRRYGLAGMSLLYVLPLFPIGLAYGRARLEWEAYAETVRATAELAGRDAASAIREHVVSQFTSGAYGWMWPFRRSVERWYDEVLRST